MKDTEKVTEAMLATVVSACEKYRMIEAEEQKAQAELHKHAKSENEAIYPKEKAMYEKLAADTSTRCLMAYQWRRDFNRFAEGGAIQGTDGAGAAFHPGPTPQSYRDWLR